MTGDLVFTGDIFKTERPVEIMKRIKYLKEFKIQVCKEAINKGNAANIARHYELCPKMVNRWVKEYKDGNYYA